MKWVTLMDKVLFVRWLLFLITLLLAENSLAKAKTPDAQAQYNQHVASEIGLDLLNNDVYEVGFGDGVAPLRGTGSHPLYSLDRDDWVRVRDLQIGERLQTAEGAVSVEALEKVRGLHRVYNLEVEGDHEYLVCVQQRLAYPAEEGSAGVRARSLLAKWQVGEKIKSLKPIDKVIFRVAANHRAVTKVNA